MRAKFICKIIRKTSTDRCTFFFKNLDISELFDTFVPHLRKKMNFEITEMEELSGDGAKIYSVTLDGDETT